MQFSKTVKLETASLLMTEKGGKSDESISNTLNVGKTYARKKRGPAATATSAQLQEDASPTQEESACKLRNFI